MVRICTLVHCAVERLVHSLVLGLVAYARLPSPRFTLGLVPTAHQPSEPSGVGFLIRAVLTFPVKRIQGEKYTNCTINRNFFGHKIIFI